ncbi:hypothetical protein GCM10008171_24170 [Methylopila jiangsuensis]|uniref:Uncharacterized protein n=1 Tax=Methylopila jiangsuensis TaxID=586230 RepID=A0A9W6JJ33_9HYPH|nr:hypothetical protein GCM10008171_24170 [Methylopila jiangsuensis]
MYFCTRAVERMPRCWTAKVPSISAAPMKKAEFSENDTGPSVPEASVQVRRTEVVSGAMAFRI